MAEVNQLTASDYIQHHLAFFTQPHREAGFWTFNVDSVAVSILLGILGIGFIWWVVRGATSGVPSRRQAFIELLIQFVDGQAETIYPHGERHRFLAPLALTVFVWTLLMNGMDLLPADWMGFITNAFSEHGFRIVPTADVNVTFALSISVLVLSIYFSVTVHGVGGWLKGLFTSPFGNHVVLWPANLLFQMVEYLSKTLSHSLRLFGNIYAGEILFLLLWVWAAHGVSGTIFGAILALGWAIFDLLIIVLQAYIFMMLAVVYIAMAHEHH